MQTAEQLRLRPLSCSIYFTFTVKNTVIALQSWADFTVDSLNEVLTFADRNSRTFPG